MKFHTIMPFVPGDVDFMAQEYRRFHKESGLDLLLPSMTLHPEGADPYKKADFFIAAFAELKRKLQGSGIRLGILLQTLIGHGWSSTQPSGRFQCTVNHTGGTRGRICPLDPGFQEYCRYTVSNLAKLGPELFLLDDDTRLLDNDKLECFCPLHLKRFSKVYKQEELIRLVMESKVGDPILREFETVRRNSLEEFCANVRKAVDSVDPSIPCGLSGAGREQIMFERMALAAAGKTEPFVRIGNALYFEGSAKELPRRIWQSAIMVKGCGKVKMILDESDTFPHNLYAKSVSGMHSHITAAILTGLRGSKMWIENFINVQAGRPNRPYEEHMLRHQGFYAELSRITENIFWKGPSVPLPDLEKNFHPREYPEYFTCTEWFSNVLGRLGIPVTFREADDPDAEAFLLTGKLVREIPDAKLPCLAGKNLFLDAPAAEFLTEKGFGKLLGTTLEPAPHFSNELDLKTNLKLRLLYNADCRKLSPVPGAEVLSILQKIPFAASPDAEEVGPGSIFYDNGKTLVAVWAGSPSVHTVSQERKEWLLNILTRLADIPAACLNEQDVFFRCGVTQEGSLLAALVNLNYDELRGISLYCREIPSKVSKLTPEGKWEEVKFSAKGDTLLIPDVCCGAYCPLILKLERV
ncbi:MAG: hypothetical protein J6A21_08595 [Lentisphaeria bacterium]|nr:hypothetical protein [Lentisphaeria bacterium]